MILLFQLIVITTIWVLMIKIATSKGMILESLGVFGEKKVEEGHKIFEVLWVCHWCMPSLHSIIGFAFAFGLGIIEKFEWKLVIIYPLCVGGTSLVCGLIWTFYNGMNSKKLYYDNAQQYYYVMTKKLKKES